MTIVIDNNKDFDLFITNNTNDLIITVTIEYFIINLNYEISQRQLDKIPSRLLKNIEKLSLSQDVYRIPDNLTNLIYLDCSNAKIEKLPVYFKALKNLFVLCSINKEIENYWTLREQAIKNGQHIPVVPEQLTNSDFGYLTWYNRLVEFNIPYSTAERYIIKIIKIIRTNQNNLHLFDHLRYPHPL